MKVYAVRLDPGEDVKRYLIDYVKKNAIVAGWLLSGIGSLSGARLRFADESLHDFSGKYELISAQGSLCSDDVHIHGQIADAAGRSYAGHVKDGCIVHTTAELLIADLEGLIFSRKFDARTGFSELEIKNR